jgi:hypothetical protein
VTAVPVIDAEACALAGFRSMLAARASVAELSRYLSTRADLIRLVVPVMVTAADQNGDRQACLGRARSAVGVHIVAFTDLALLRRSMPSFTHHVEVSAREVLQCARYSSLIINPNDDSGVMFDREALEDYRRLQPSGEAGGSREGACTIRLLSESEVESAQRVRDWCAKVSGMRRLWIGMISFGRGAPSEPLVAFEHDDELQSANLVRDLEACIRDATGHSKHVHLVPVRPGRGEPGGAYALFLSRSAPMYERGLRLGAHSE